MAYTQKIHPCFQKVDWLDLNLKKTRNDGKSGLIHFQSARIQLIVYALFLDQ